ncbi:MAG: GNAT family N-acetyltransferase, partial [Bacteroidota bacterium]
MIVRTATPEDLPALFSLWLELMEAHKQYHRIFELNQDNQDSIRKELKKKLSDPNAEVLVAQETIEFPIGGMIIIRYSEKPEAMKIRRQGYIAETVVNETHRGKGMGSALVSAAETWFQDRKVDHVELQV